MQLDTIEIDQTEAAARLKEYQDSLRHDRNREDEQIAAGYRAAAKGFPIIRLSEVVAAGGYFDSGLPRIAVVGAHVKVCFATRDDQFSRSTATYVFSSEPLGAGWYRQNRGALVNKRTVRVTVPWDETHDWRRGVSRNAGSTIVPTIPPAHRPKLTDPRRFHILWEVEEWAPVSPRDPALIKWIGGDLWAVHATWDLTELERAVLTSRMPS